jgi:hypothetical protein
MGPVFIKAYSQADSSVILNSSVNPETWFRTGNVDRFREIFPGPGSLMATGT